MFLAALDDRLVEHVAYRARQRLGPVQHGQDRVGDVQVPLAQPDQQVPYQGRVLRAAFDQGQWVLGAVDADAQRHHTQVLGEANPVDHHRDQVKAGQVGGHQLRQRSFRGGHEAAGDRRAAGRGRRRIDLVPDRLKPVPVAAGGQPGQHAFQRHAAQHLGRGEQLVGRQAHLTVAVGGAYPWSAYRHPPAAQRHRAVLVTVAHRGPVGHVLALRPDQRRDVGVHHRVHHLHAAPTARASKPSFADSAIWPNEISTSSGTAGVGLVSPALFW